MAIIAGTVSTVIFAASVLPMLIKAIRTRDLSSYSRGNLVLANVGNAVHSLYVAQLPAGPIWALHSFYVLTLGPDAHLASALRQRVAPGGRHPRYPSELTMRSPEHVETVIIGAGQAGLATAYHLRRRGRPCLVLDANQRIGDNWRTHWDTLRLYSPAGSDGLPGLPFPGPRWSYPTKDEVADYLAAYAERFALPVRTGVRVDRLEARDGGYALRIGTRDRAGRERRRGDGYLRPHPEHPRVRAGSRPRDPPAALQRVPPAGPATARPGAGGRRLALGHRHRVRGGAQPPDGAGRPGSRRSCRSGWITGARGCSGRCSCSSART